MLTIAARTLGSRKPLFADFSIPLPPELDRGEGGPATLRDVIERIVIAEVRSFRERQQARRLDRVMTRAQIEGAADSGRIAPEGRGLQQTAREDDAVATALQAFEDGLYLVIIDECEYRDLEAPVYLQPDSRVTFIRLVFLAGA